MGRCARSLPVDPPASSRHPHPKQPLRRRPTGVVVKNRSALIESPRMRGLTESESLAIEVMAELVTQGTEKSAERRDLLPYRRPRPDSDDGGVERVVSEELARPAALADPERADRKSAHWRNSNVVEFSCGR